jgi:peptide deformylase
MDGATKQMVQTILTFPDPELKKKSHPVTVINEKTRELVRDMAETMYASPADHRHRHIL